MESIQIHPIAHIRSDYPDKFGIPRQSGLVDTMARIVFEPAYRNPDALRGLEEYSHLWLIWHFSQSMRKGWSPTVRPPRLGGNTRMGVFATRSPFRPNALGLSSVKLCRIDLHTPEGPVLYVSGADLLDGTPIWDIKPYLSFTDSHPDAVGGFADGVKGNNLAVVIPPEWGARIPVEKRNSLCQLLAQDPRPAYQENPTREYALLFSNMQIRFTVKENTLTVTKVEML